MVNMFMGWLNKRRGSTFVGARYLLVPVLIAGLVDEQSRVVVSFARLTLALNDIKIGISNS